MPELVYGILMSPKDHDHETVLKRLEEIDEASENFLLEVDMHHPRQVEIFWIGTPIECQYIIITHDEYRDDDEVIINGPYSGNKFLNKIDNILNEPRWKQSVEGGPSKRFDPATATSSKITTRRENILDIFQGLDRTLGAMALRDPQPHLHIMGDFLNTGIAMLIRGNIFELDNGTDIFKEHFDDEVDSDSTSENEGSTDSESDENGEVSGQSDETQGHTESEDDGVDADESDEATEESLYIGQELNALGTYFYKPVWIGGTPELEFKDRILINLPLEFETVLSTEIDGSSLYFTKDGFIGVDESEDKEYALNLLNTLFGASVLLNHPFEAATREDLMSVLLEDDEIKRKRGDPSIRRSHASTEYHSSVPYRYGPTIERQVVEVEYIEDLCDLVNELFQNQELKERLNSTLQSYTHHVNEEYTQAYLLAWISIEQYINSALDQFLKQQKDVNSDRRRELRRGGHWGSSHLLEMMEISNCISNDRYSKLTRMRRKRNDIVHKTENATKEESENIVNLSFLLIDEELSDEESGPDFLTE